MHTYVNTQTHTFTWKARKCNVNRMTSGIEKKSVKKKFIIEFIKKKMAV